MAEPYVAFYLVFEEMSYNTQNIMSDKTIGL